MKRMKKDVARVMDEAVARGETPCALTLLWRRGEEKFYGESGYADLGRNLPVTRDTLFRLYSLSKPITAVTAMTLAERGLLDLYAPVSEYLPGFCDQRVALSDTKSVPVKRAMLVRDLFSMTSGLPYDGTGSPAERAMDALFRDLQAEARAGEPADTVSVANRIGRLPLAFHPGARWQYGVSADVLGAVVQAIVLKPLEEYMAEAVFEPLGMKDTGFYVPEEKRARLATLYEHKDGILSPVLFEPGSMEDCFTRGGPQLGGGGLISTLDDVLRFARMLLGKGEAFGERVLSARSVEWLSQNHLSAEQMSTIPWDSMDGYGYGGLMRVLLEPARGFSLGVAGEFGWDGYAGAYLSVCPAEDLILLVLQHRAGSGTNALTRKVRNIVYGALN